MPIREWTVANLGRFDALEITVDHYLTGGPATRRAILDLVGRVPLTAHGIGLSIGTDVPIDMPYLDRVADVLARIGAPRYSEHLAFTRAPGIDLANLLPLPRTEAVAEGIIEKVRTVQARIPVPFELENISYLFTYPDSTMDDAEFFSLILGETGCGMLLDVHNLHVNSVNHGFDPKAFLDALPPDAVATVHAAGGSELEGVLTDSHDHAVPDAALDLLDHALARQRPATIIVERDDRLHEVDQIAADVDQIRTRLARLRPGSSNDDTAAVGQTG